MKTILILSNEKYILPTAVQSAIRAKFAFKSGEVTHQRDGSLYMIYLNLKYVCSFNSSGEEHI